jgi:hypothetical protein
VADWLRNNDFPESSSGKITGYYSTPFQEIITIFQRLRKEAKPE